MEEVASWGSDPVKMLSTEYANAVGRLSTCVRKTRWANAERQLARLRLRLTELEAARKALEECGPLTPSVVKAARRHFSGEGADLVVFAHALSKRGLVDEAKRAIAQFAQFDPEMARLALVLATSHQQREEATAALRDVVIDADQPLRVRLLGAWFLATKFDEPDLGDGILMSLLAAALREDRWESVKRVLGAVRSVLRIRTGEAKQWGEEEDAPNFRMEFEQLKFDAERAKEKGWELFS